MRETEARKAELERQHAEAQNQLREKIAGRYQGPESVEALQSKIRELEKKTELQMVRHEELSLELTSLRRARSRGPMVGHSTILTTWPPTGSEIDRIIAKIEQDNRCVSRYSIPINIANILKHASILHSRAIDILSDCRLILFHFYQRSASRMVHDLDHTRGSITTQQPSATQSILRSSSENLPNLSQHPPHPHALSLGMPTQMSHVCKKLFSFRYRCRHVSFFLSLSSLSLCLASLCSW